MVATQPSVTTTYCSSPNRTYRAHNFSKTSSSCLTRLYHHSKTSLSIDAAPIRTLICSVVIKICIARDVY
jgi:hypothetical protein